MIASLALAAVAITGGTLATYTFDRQSPGYARLATGTFVGVTTLAFSGFLFALALGLNAASLALAAAAAGLPVLVLRSPTIRGAVGRDLGDARSGLVSRFRHPTRGCAVVALYAASIAVGVWLVADRTLYEVADGLYIGNVNNLGDLPYHLQITASFAYGANFPPQNPVFAGSGFSYHYAADFLAAMFVAAGATLREGMMIVTVALGAGLLTLVHRWTRDLTGSAIAARLAPLLLAFGGGLGWLFLLHEARVGEHGLLSAFAASDARYTIQNDGILRFGNPVTTLLIPQRGLLLGMGLAVIVFTLIWRHLDELAPGPRDPSGSRADLRRLVAQPRMLVAGVLTGLLPIVHIHTFAVVFGTAFLLGVFFRQWRDGRWRGWAVYVASAGLVAVPLLVWTARGSQAGLASFFGLELGWDHGANNPLWFWFLNTGAFIPLLVLAFAWRGNRPLLPRKLILYALPFMAWFIVPNVFRLAPWIWDNIKVLVYWWLGSVPLVALVLARLWERRLAAKAGAVALAFVLMTAGGLDVARATVGQGYQEFDRDGIAFAEMIRERTAPGSVILTAPTYNTPVFLTGRRVFMGYAGFIWANGLPFEERDRELRAIYAGEPGAEDTARRYGISYIVVGPQEVRDVTPNDAFLSRLPLVGQIGEYRLYRMAGQ